jgi:hypothetical protein
LQRTTQLEYLNIKSVENLETHNGIDLSYMTTLKELYLADENFEEHSSGYDDFNNLPVSLELLSFSECTFEDISTQLLRFTRLKFLDLEDCTTPGQSLELQAFPSLETLTIHYNNPLDGPLGDESDQEEAEQFTELVIAPSSSHLRKVTLSGTSITVDLIELLRSAKNLQELDLRGANVVINQNHDLPPHPLKALALRRLSNGVLDRANDIINSCSQLQSLYLSNIVGQGHTIQLDSLIDLISLDLSEIYNVEFPRLPPNLSMISIDYDLGKFMFKDDLRIYRLDYVCIRNIPRDQSAVERIVEGLQPSRDTLRSMRLEYSSYPAEEPYFYQPDFSNFQWI